MPSEYKPSRIYAPRNVLKNFYIQDFTVSSEQCYGDPCQLYFLDLMSFFKKHTKTRELNKFWRGKLLERGGFDFEREWVLTLFQFILCNEPLYDINGLLSTFMCPLI